ncbi:MAG: hypothetical protein RLY86_289 [Pseudomonadota bacterium]|jgi:signal transduction histidine kinase
MSAPSCDEELRVRQAMHLVKMMPFLVFGNVAVAGGIAYQSWGLLRDSGALWFLLAEVVVLLPMVRSWVRLRNAPRPARVSTRHIRRVRVHSAVMGALWTVAAGLAFPVLSPFDQYVMMTGIGVLALGGAATIYAIPKAALLYIGPLWLTLFFCALVFDGTGNGITTVSSLITGISAACILRANWLTFTDNVRTAAERAQFLYDSHAAREAVEQALADLRSMQDTVVQSEKLASLGQLVAGVAHEINTPIGIAVTGASMMVEEVERVDGLMQDGKLRKSDLAAAMGSVRQAATVVLSNLHRAADLIQSFKTMAVEQTAAERRSFDLGDYARDVMASLNPALSRGGICVRLDLAPGVMVDSYPGAVSQVLTNLAMNALTHAFEPGQGGTLSVTLTPPVGTGPAQLVVADDGCGIPADHLPRLFDPFFTTRRGSGGSGLGLHIVYNLVTGMLGGRVQVESTVGCGTRFLVSIPMTAPSVVSGPGAPQAAVE